jgi:hypothetical protein
VPRRCALAPRVGAASRAASRAATVLRAGPRELAPADILDDNLRSQQIIERTLAFIQENI